MSYITNYWFRLTCLLRFTCAPASFKEGSILFSHIHLWQNSEYCLWQNILPQFPDPKLCCLEPPWYHFPCQHRGCTKVRSWPPPRNTPLKDSVILVPFRDPNSHFLLSPSASSRAGCAQLELEPDTFCIFKSCLRDVGLSAFKEGKPRCPDNFKCSAPLAGHAHDKLNS